MIPAWKLKRELTRLRVKLKGIFQATYEPFLQRQHDRWRKQNCTGKNGKVAYSGKVALFLLYQPNGVSKTILQTLRHLTEKGYAPLVISNTCLSELDRTNVIDHCWKYAERQNFGYDFGGYRDGMWLLNQMDIWPDVLLVLNDSVWFPITESSDLLSEMESSPADYVGTQVFRRPKTAGVTKRRAKYFFGSYCFMLKKAAFEHPGFQSFWSSYRLTSNKEKTLRRGEEAFSGAMFETGLPSEGLFSRERFNELVAKLPVSELHLALKSLICLDPVLEARRIALLETGASKLSVDKARALIQDAAESKNYIGSSPVISLRHLNFPMIKKNNEMLYTRARQAILSAHSEGDLPRIDPVVLEEIQARTTTQRSR